MDPGLLQRFIRGDCSPAETQQVRQFFATPEGQRVLANLIDGQLPLRELPLPPHERPAAEQLFARIDAARRRASRPRSDAPPTTLPETPVRRLGQRHYVPFGWQGNWVAATVALLVLAVGSWWFWLRPTAAPTVTIRTPFGQTRTVSLPDGSTVTLNGNSSVTYPERWTAREPRNVWITGEGFFDVVHTRNHQRFRVRLPSGISVDVLGTRFDVYARKAQTKVVLDTGKIRLNVGSDARKSMDMKPGDMFEADMQRKTYSVRRVNAQAHSSWRSDKLILDSVSLRDIGQMLEDTYGVQVRIADPALAAQTFSGTIPNHNLDTILRGLSALYDLNITRTNQLLIIDQNKPRL